MLAPVAMLLAIPQPDILKPMACGAAPSIHTKYENI
jgi:hypothetical protein